MSTTTNLGLFKHDNPATNTDKFDVDKALNQNWDKVDSGIGNDRDRLDLLEASNTIYNFKGTVDTLTNLQSKTKTQGDVWYCEENSTYYTYTGTDWIPVNLNLKLGVIDELEEKTIKCLQEVETPTPKSGTSLDLSDSTDAKVTELKISGNSEQKTSEEGDNWLDTSLLVDETKDGITLTKQNDGSILLNGTATKSLSFLTSLKRTIKNTNSTHALIIGKISGTISESSLYTYLSNSDNTKTTGTPSLNSNNSVASTNLSADVEYTKMIIGINSGTVLDNVKIFVEVCTSGTNTYIPFKPNMPSLEYSSEIESCGDNIQLFDKDTNIISKRYFGTSGQIETSTADNNYLQEKYIDVKSNTKYTAFGGTYIRICEYNTDKNFIKITNSGTSTNLTITTSDTTKYIRISFSGNLNDIKIVEGIETSGYSAYGQGCINEVICNKNRLYIPDQERTISGINVKAVNGKVTLNGTWNTGGNWIYLNIDMTLEAGSYKNTSIRSGTAGSALPGWIVVDDDDNEYSSTHLASISKKTHFKTMKAWSNGMGTVSNYTDLTQIEKGTTATDYIEHQSQTYTIPTQQPFRSIGDIRDTFIKKNNKWYERHWIKEISLKYARVKGNNCYYYVEDKQTNIKKPSSNTETVNWIQCNMAKSGVSANYLNNNDVVGISIATDGNIGLNFSNVSGLTTIELATQFLEEHDVYAHFVMETPQDIECTEEQSTILFDIEQNAKTYKNITHIYSTDNVGSYKEVTYKKDIEKLFANTLVESGV